MTRFLNLSSEKSKRQALRNNMPEAERRLWQKIRKEQIQGCKFRRQYSVGSFVIDFYSPEIKLAIEVDGPSHFQAGDDVVHESKPPVVPLEKRGVCRANGALNPYDRERQTFIESFGIAFLRFTNHDVYHNMNGVLEQIAMAIRDLRQAKAKEVNLPVVPLGKGAGSNPPVVPLGKGAGSNPPVVPLGKGAGSNPPVVPLGKGDETRPVVIPLEKGDVCSANRGSHD